jgi:hypothetical protein
MFAIATINASNGINTTAVIENTFGLFEISFGREAALLRPPARISFTLRISCR